MIVRGLLVTPREVAFVVPSSHPSVLVFVVKKRRGILAQKPALEMLRIVHYLRCAVRQVCGSAWLGVAGELAFSIGLGKPLCRLGGGTGGLFAFSHGARGDARGSVEVFKHSQAVHTRQ